MLLVVTDGMLLDGNGTLSEHMAALLMQCGSRSHPQSLPDSPEAAGGRGTGHLGTCSALRSAPAASAVGRTPASPAAPQGSSGQGESVWLEHGSLQQSPEGPQRDLQHRRGSCCLPSVHTVLPCHVAHAYIVHGAATNSCDTTLCSCTAHALLTAALAPDSELRAPSTKLASRCT
jgi:hypothetical protein